MNVKISIGRILWARFWKEGKEYCWARWLDSMNPVREEMLGDRVREFLQSTKEVDSISEYKKHWLRFVETEL